MKANTYSIDVGDVSDRPAVQRRWVHVLLFLITLFTTTAAGSIQQGVDLLSNPWALSAGLPFAVTLMTILLVHEMGHYLTARYHGVHASLPYFIPAPPFPFIIGTFGAFIRMQSPPVNRRVLFDVGAAGPIAGLVLAVPAVIVGLMFSTVTFAQEAGGFLNLGSSILFDLVSQWTLGVRAADPNMVLYLHPVAFAGWIGLFVTTLNLLPVGQLDGGHVVYALFGHHQIWVSRAAVMVMLVLGLSGYWEGWLVWSGLLLVVGLRHPPPQDARTPLDGKRKLAAWLVLAILALTFIPSPFSLGDAVR